MLDVGAGDGWFAGELKSSLPPSAEVICWDVNYSGDDLAEPMPAGLSRVVDPPDGRFDLITVLDVIEHVVDDAAFLDEDVLPRLAPDGLLVVSVPAHQALFCAHDVALGHHRRYSAPPARRPARTAGGDGRPRWPLLDAARPAPRRGRPGAARYARRTPTASAHGATGRAPPQP